jgi:hypothetical protein
MVWGGGGAASAVQLANASAVYQSGSYANPIHTDTDSLAQLFILSAVFPNTADVHIYTSSAE